MHILYIVFRLVLELVVMFALIDYAEMNRRQVKQLMPSARGIDLTAAYFIVALLIAALLLRLYVFNPIVP